MIAIGMDIGHSAVKLSYPTTSGAKHECFPSAVITATEIADDAERARANLDMVMIHESARGAVTKYFVGETAIIQGAVAAPGLSKDWIKSPKHAALIVAAWNKLNQLGIGEPEDRLIVVGLPADFYSEQKDSLLESCKALMPGAKIHVLMQPIAALQTVFFDENGDPMPGRSLAKESWAVIDIGHFTTDIVSLENGRFQAHSRGSCSGVNIACIKLIELVKSAGFGDISPIEAEQILRKGTLMDFGQEVDVRHLCAKAYEHLVSEVRSEAERLLGGNVRRMHGVLLAGGGADIFYEVFKPTWKNAIRSEHGRFAVSEGMRRLATHIQKQGSGT